MESKYKCIAFRIGNLPIPNDKSGKMHVCFLVQVQQGTQVTVYVKPILRNRSEHAAVSAAYGDGNSGHLKREPYPFQMSDATARVRCRIFYNSLSNGFRGVFRWLSFCCKHISLEIIRQPFDNLLKTICKATVNHLTNFFNYPEIV